MENKINEPRKYECMVGDTTIRGTVVIRNQTGIRDYSVVASIDQTNYTFHMTMCGLGATPMYVTSGFTITARSVFIHFPNATNPMQPAALFEYVLTRISGFHMTKMI